MMKGILKLFDKHNDMVVLLLPKEELFDFHKLQEHIVNAEPYSDDWYEFWDEYDNDFSKYEIDLEEKDYIAELTNA